MVLKILTGGLHVIPSRVLLDVVAWVGMVLAIQTPVRNTTIGKNEKNPSATKRNSYHTWILLATMGVTLATTIRGISWTARWSVAFPMIPLGLLQGLRHLFVRLSDSKIIFFTSYLLVFLSMALCVLFPPLQLPHAQAGGPYAVGAATFFLPISVEGSACPATELSSFAVFNHSHVQVKLFYPTALKISNDNMNTATTSTTTNKKKTTKMPYLSSSPQLALAFLQESMKAAAPAPIKAFDWLLHHWLEVEVPVEPNAPLLELEEKKEDTEDARQSTTSQPRQLPLVVYSHGLMGSADLYAYQTMSLASQGVFVLAVNHLDGSAPIAEHVDGKSITFDYDIIQLWHDGKKEDYVRERRRRTDWRVQELIGATDALLAWNDRENDNKNKPLGQGELPPPPHWILSSLRGRIQTDSIFFMGHSWGGATALTAAHRRPDLVSGPGGVIAHEPAVDWMPDDARWSLLPMDRWKGLESSLNYTGGTGGLEYHANATTTEAAAEASESGDSSTGTTNPATTATTVHELNLLLLFSEQWRRLVS